VLINYKLRWDRSSLPARLAGNKLMGSK